MFSAHPAGDIPGINPSSPAGAMGAVTMLKRPIGIIVVVYIVVGLVVAWDRGYLTVGLLKDILSAILAILLWWLPLLGVSLHLH
jgi:hypothetical protein